MRTRDVIQRTIEQRRRVDAVLMIKKFDGLVGSPRNGAPSN